MTAVVNPYLDTNTLASESRLAREVRSFWHLWGFVHVTAEAQEMLASNGRRFVGIKSNLKNGLPPGATPSEVAAIYRRKEMPFA